MNVRRIGIAGAVIIAVVTGISFGLETRDTSLAPDVDWSAPARCRPRRDRTFARSS